MVFHKNYFYFLILILFSVWLSAFSIDNKLHIIACDVGQGDAILLQKNTTQILIDGGPNQKVLDCLGKHMPFWDRTVEVVFLTHPDIDHYGGLIDV
ncbi:MAG: MBL fold metallo-hydrolase, partial [Patescibacteria group bacterium]